ncbi:hypothetical protein ARALYDRAFT_890485 [Arabidopsis lyrata subsp. lyrata]|uniref:C3H1-type domain-containing protein n=1 Tax=Arabidopsis lyrata subsp. lyrata TaxID=81972 RepID=D7KDV4_ARALL|nr:hypothetical protein ARALYDRAFT_890485 [Arabidopsis lyrata subsp. lyrata]
MADARENQQEAERRSDEIESRSIEEPKEKKDEDENLQEQKPSSIGSSIPSSDKSKEDDAVKSISSVKDCQFYVETGLCRFCRYNHPIQLPKAKTILDSGEPNSRERLEDLEDGEIRGHDNPQEQIQINTERQGTVAQDNLQFHQQQEMQRPQSHTTQQQQSVQTPQQHQLLASHFNIYPSVESLTDAIEAGTRDHNSDSLVTEVSSHFDKRQQILNSISRSLGSKTNKVEHNNKVWIFGLEQSLFGFCLLVFLFYKYVDGQKQNLEESEQLLQQRKELMEEYKKAVEEIVKKEP